MGRTPMSYHESQFPVPLRSRRLGRRLVVNAVAAGAVILGSYSGLFISLSVQAQEPIKVGVMGPFTGPASRTGEGIQKGAMMAVEEAGAEVLLPVTVDGEERDLDLVWVDSESSRERAVRALADAVNREGVEIMVSGWHSSVAMAIAEAEIGMGIVHIGHGGERSEERRVGKECRTRWAPHV